MFICIQVCSRRVLTISLHVHRLWISLLIECIPSCHHCFKMSSSSLEKNRFPSVDLTCWADQLTTTFTILNCLEYEFLKGFFWSKGDSSHFENSPSSQISWSYHDVFQINEKFIHNYPLSLLAEMANVASSVATPRECYIRNHSTNQIAGDSLFSSEIILKCNYERKSTCYVLP